MRTSGDFTIHEYTINFQKWNEPIYLIPFGDVHRSSPMCAVERWLEMCDWAEQKERCYFLGMGDYDDLGSTSERRYLNNPELHDSTVKTLEDLYLKNTRRFADEIKFMKGKLIGLLNGNHYGMFQSGINTDQKLAEIMHTTYLGANTFIRLKLKSTTKHKGYMTIDIWAHHGRGGGRTVGGSMNPVEQMSQSAEADIYLMGDNHQKSAVHKSRLRLSDDGQLGLSHRKILLCRTGSFLKGYEQNCKSYIVDAGLPPTELGVVKIELTPKRQLIEKSDSAWIDIHASV
jgi:hypothetical protein